MVKMITQILYIKSILENIKNEITFARKEIFYYDGEALWSVVRSIEEDTDLIISILGNDPRDEE